jgi:hypothetical protein
VDLTVVGKAVGMFAVTNVDDVVVLTLYFGQAPGRVAAVRVTAGQYLGFAGILAVAVVGAAGAGLLPDSVWPTWGCSPSRSDCRRVGECGHIDMSPRTTREHPAQQALASCRSRW